MKPLFNFIGCGKVGRAFAHLIYTQNAGIIQAVVNTSRENAETSCRFIGAGQPYFSLEKLPEADVTVIASEDETIQTLCENLCHYSGFKSGSVVLHFSGCLSSIVLASAKAYQCKLGSLHPVKSFADPLNAVNTFADTLCTFEGDDSAFEMIMPIVKKIGGQITKIHPDFKTLYHASCVIANNFATTLHFVAAQLFQSVGLDELQANKISTSLILDALKNLQNQDHAHALTGPVARGDSSTVKAHLDALTSNKDVESLYKALTKLALAIPNLTEDKQRQIMDLLK